MKPETAIEFLQVLRNRKQGHEKEALEMAIKALKHQAKDEPASIDAPEETPEKKKRTVHTVKGTTTIDAPPARVSGPDPNKK